MKTDEGLLKLQCAGFKFTSVVRSPRNQILLIESTDGQKSITTIEDFAITVFNEHLQAKRKLKNYNDRLHKMKNFQSSNRYTLPDDGIKEHVQLQGKKWKKRIALLNDVKKQLKAWRRHPEVLPLETELRSIQRQTDRSASIRELKKDAAHGRKFKGRKIDWERIEQYRVIEERRKTHRGSLKCLIENLCRVPTRDGIFDDCVGKPKRIQALYVAYCRFKEKSPEDRYALLYPQE